MDYTTIQGEKNIKIEFREIAEYIIYRCELFISSTMF
jgi:hypothetical protein